MSIKKSCYTVFFIISGMLNAQAQHALTEGKVVNELGIAIPYVSLALSQARVGTVTDSEGNFELYLNHLNQNDSIQISSLGYETLILGMQEIALDKPNVIVLTAKDYEIGDVVVSGNFERKIVEQAIKAIPVNYPVLPYQFSAFYRQEHKEDGKSVRLIEALMEVQDKGYKNRSTIIQQEKVNIKAVRRSNVSEKNGYEHGDHLMELFPENPVRYPAGTVLDMRNLSRYLLYLDSIQPADVNQVAICFKYKGPQNQYPETGRLIIDTTDYGILSVSMETNHLIAYKPFARYEDDDWERLSSQVTIRYGKYNRYYWPGKIAYHYKHRVRDQYVKHRTYIVEERFSLWTYGEAGFLDMAISQKGFSRITNLYTSRYTYNPEDWKLPVVNEQALPKSSQAQMERFESLEQQFKQNAVKFINADAYYSKE